MGGKMPIEYKSILSSQFTQNRSFQSNHYQKGEPMALNSRLAITSVLTFCLFNPLAGCTTTILKDKTTHPMESRVHCSGGKWVDDSSIAVLPIPVVAFFVPHVDLHEVEGASALNQCGEPTQVVNRQVSISRTACIPAGLSKIVTLGIWQWCPAHVDWEADVIIR